MGCVRFAGLVQVSLILGYGAAQNSLNCVNWQAQVSNLIGGRCCSNFLIQINVCYKDWY